MSDLLDRPQKSTTDSRKNIIYISHSPQGFGEIIDALEPDMFESEMPIQHSYSAFEDDDIGLYIGLWDTTDMIESAGPYPCEEFMTVIEGVVEIKNNQTGVTETVIAGESFIIPRGYDCQWHQKGYLRKFYVISELSEAATGNKPQGIKKIPRKVLDGYTIYYSNTKESFIAGTWQGFCMDVEEEPIEKHKFIYLHTGELTITELGGKERFVHCGEAIFIPCGTTYTWRTECKTILHWMEISK
jgi:hypothetical protein